MSEKMPPFGKERFAEITESEAAERLQSEQRLSKEEQERLVSMITDPNLSFDVLGFEDTHEGRLTRAQEEKLLEQILADREVAEILYITLTESGVELNERESRWMERLQKIIN